MTGDGFNTHTPNGGRVSFADGTGSFAVGPLDEWAYTNAQIDDYQTLRRRDFRWPGPLTLSIEARFSPGIDGLRGTAGFGFWNDPFMMTGARPPTLPRALWFFFAGPHSDMKLDLDTPGHGWKAATVDAIRPGFLALAPTAPLAVPLMNIKPLYRALWPLGQRAIGVKEAALDLDMTAWHHYQIDRGEKLATFRVNGEVVLEAPAPRGRLGFVMWIDNQTMTVTPWGKFGWRVVPLDAEQRLEIRGLKLTH